MQPAREEPPARKAGGDNESRRQGVFDPAALRARLERRLDQMKREEKNINDALGRLDKGEAPEEIAKGLRPEGRVEGRPDLRGNGFRGDGRGDLRSKPDGGKSAMQTRPGAEGGDDHERVMGQLREHMPQLAERMEAWRKTDPESANRILGRLGPRVREAAELHDRDPEMFALKASEVESGFAVMEATRGVVRARTEGDENGREGRLQEAKEKLRSALGAQFDVRMAVQAKEIEALEQRLVGLRADHESQSSKREHFIEERTQKMSDPESWPEGIRKRMRDGVEGHKGEPKKPG